MSPSLRYGLACTVLIAAAASALPFRQTGPPMTDGDPVHSAARKVSLADQNPPSVRVKTDVSKRAAPRDVVPVAGLVAPVMKPASTQDSNDRLHNKNSTNAPEFTLGFAPINPDNEWTPVPTKKGGESIASRPEQSARRVIPARETKYLPRAFRRTIDNRPSNHPRYIPQ